MRKIFALITVMAFSFLMVACGEITLSAPSISLSNEGVVSWTAVENADHYVIFIDTNTRETTETSYDLSQEGLAVGTYTIYVVAAAGADNVSLPSNSLTYEVAGNNTALGVPSNVVITGSTLTWDTVTNATGYIITVDGTDHNVSQTTFDLSTLGLSEGTYPVTVKATDGTNQSAASTTVNYVVVTVTELDTPTNLVLNGDVLTWDQVSNAEGYLVMINGYGYEVLTPTVDLATLYLPSGTFDVVVVAVHGDIESSASTSVSYTISAQSVSADVYEAVLLVMNTSYVPDMVEADFETEEDYIDYERSSEMALYYANATHDLAMTTQESINMFTDMHTLMTQTEVMSMTQMMSELEMLDTYHVTPERFTELLYGFAPLALNQQIARTTRRVDQLTIDHANYQATLDAFYQSTQFMNFYQVLAEHATPENMYVIDYMFNHEYKWAFAEAFNTMAGQYFYNGQFVDNGYYWFVPEEYHEDIMAMEQIVMAIYNDEPSRSFLGDMQQLWNITNQLYPMQDNVMWSSEDLERREQEFAQLSRVLTMMNSHEVQNREGLYVVVQFLFTLRENIPTSLIESMDEIISGEAELTPQEILIIKDELVNLLQSAVPEAEDFAALHNIAFAFAGSMLDVDLSAFEAESQFLGEMDVATIELALYFIEDFTVLDLGNVMPIIEAMMESENGPDPYDVIDLLTFIKDYVDTFTTTHQTDIDEFNALIGSEHPEIIYNLILAEFIDYAENNIEDEHERALFLYVFNDIADSYDDVIIILDMVKTLGIDTVVNLITTEGDIIDSIIALDEAMDDTARMNAIIALLNDVDSYLLVLIDDLSPDQFEALISFAKLPFVITVYEQLGLNLTLEELDDIVENLYPHIGQTIHAELELMLMLIESIDDTDITTVYNLVMTVTDEYGELQVPEFIDLIDYIYTFINDFMADHPTQVQTLEDLVIGDSAETLYLYVLNTVLTYLNAIPVEEQTMETEVATYLVTELLGSFDHFVMVQDIIRSIGANAIDELIITDGAIIDLIINTPLVEFMTEAETLAFMQDVLDQFITYYPVIDTELTEMQIDHILSLVRIPVVISAYLNSESGLTLTELDTLADAAYPYILDIVMDVVGLERAVAAQIELLDLATYYGTAGYTTDPELAIYMMMIDVLDTVVTQNETVIDGIVASLFDDIFSMANVQTLFTMTPQDVIDARTNLETMVSDFKADLSTVASLDFSNLLEADIDVIINFMFDYGLHFPLSFEEQMMMSEVLIVDSPVEVPEFNEYYYYQFTATTEGTYRITSSGIDADPIVVLYNMNLEFMAEFDDIDYPDDKNFDGTFYMNAGDTVYFEIHYFDEYFPFTITLTDITPPM